MKKFGLIFVIIAATVLMLQISVSATDSDTKVNSIFENATEYNGNYYLLIKGDYTWEQARAYCEGLGGHLATISSQGEDDACFQLWKESGAKGCWLGGSDLDLEGIWKWITNEPWNYSNWGDGEPNGGTKENVLNYYGSYSNGKWNDSGTDDSFPFICEWENNNISYVDKTYGYITSSGMIYNDSFYYNGNVYKVFKYDMSYEQAKSYCEQLGGHLATITSKEEDKAIFAYISKIGNYDCVLGGSDAKIEGLWEWITGEPFSYANWNGGEPNNEGDEDYIQYGKTGKWNDIRWKNCFLCEWDNCCILPDGTVSEHSFGEPIVIKSATCTSKGELKRVCAGCGAEIVESVEILPHVFNNWIITVEPTCHSEGEKARSCQSCGYAESQSIDILAHEWNEWLVSVPATCHDTGISERTCKLCNDKEQQTIEKLMHDYGDYVAVSGSKLIPPIVKEKTCSLCGDVQTYRDWSNIWITILAFVGAIGVLIGIVGYVRAFRKK